MYTTTHYGLNIVEGTDVVNPLIQQNPNFEAIDAAMYANKKASIGSATELTAGTVHTITRANTDSNYIRFTATSNWTAGDTMIIDSTPVAVYLSDGTVPGDGAYIINTEVLLILNGTRVTLIASAGPDNAADVSYNNSVSGLSATNVKEALDEIATQEIIKTTMVPNVIVPAGGYTFVNYTRPSGYKLISVNAGTNSLALFTQISTFGNVDRIAMFNAYTQDITVDATIELIFARI